VIKSSNVTLLDHVARTKETSLANKILVENSKEKIQFYVWRRKDETKMCLGGTRYEVRGCRYWIESTQDVIWWRDFANTV